jgi:hypothetical protein
MGQAPRYDRPTVPVATRLTEDARRILDFVVLRTDTPSVADYIRSLIEDNLISLGFDLQPGIHRALPRPLGRDEVAAWNAEEVARRGRQPC